MGHTQPEYGIRVQLGASSSTPKTPLQSPLSQHNAGSLHLTTLRNTTELGKTNWTAPLCCDKEQHPSIFPVTKFNWCSILPAGGPSDGHHTAEAQARNSSESHRSPTGQDCSPTDLQPFVLEDLQSSAHHHSAESTMSKLATPLLASGAQRPSAKAETTANVGRSPRAQAVSSGACTRKGPHQPGKQEAGSQASGRGCTQEGGGAAAEEGCQSLSVCR